MPSIKDLKKRIGSVKNTQQTTKAMKMVSAAKLRRAQDSITHHRPYAKQVGSLIQLLSGMAHEAVESPLFTRDVTRESGKKKLLMVVITSDRGLCGAFNSSITKTAQRWIDKNKSDYESVEMMYVGRKGYEFFKRRGMTEGSNYTPFGSRVAFASAKKLADTLLEAYLSERVDEVKLVYNEFKNAITQKPLVEHFLPLGAASAGTEDRETIEAAAAMLLVKPSVGEVLDQLLKKNFAIQTYRMLLESQASEHGARMSSMDSATRNAGEMIQKLTLQFNKQRQAAITKELLEIISGSESQKQTG